MAVVATTTYSFVDVNLTHYYVQGVELSDRGAWSSITTYSYPDVVQIGADQYVAIAPNTNTPPSALVDENWSILVVYEEQTIISSGSDWYARLIALEALQVGSTALQVGSNALQIGAIALDLAGDAYALAMIGTNTGTAALNAAAAAQATASGAYAIAVDGTNAATAAQLTATSAYALAQIGTNTGTAALAAAAGAQATAAAAFAIAVDGTNLASVALDRANEAYVLAEVGTNTGTAAYNLAAAAYALALAGTASGTVAQQASDRANAAYALAQIGTNTGTAALGAASTAQSRADSAFSIAVAGTNAAATAQSRANAAYALAQIGTNTGTAALTAAGIAQATANAAFSIAVAGTNAAANAYRLAMVGTNTGTAAYDLAAAAYALAISGTAAGTYSGTLAQQAFDRANAAYTLAMIGTNTGTAALTAAASAQSSANAALILAAAGTVNPPLYALPDVNIPAPTAQQVLTFDGSRWVASEPTSTTSPSAFTYYLYDTATGTAGYASLTTAPVGTPEEVDTVSFSGGTVGLIEGYLSGTLNRTLLDAGIWEFNTYASVSDAASSAQIIVEVYTRNVAGIETFRFSGTSGTIAVEAPILFSTLSAQGTFSVALSDKLVAKYYGRRTGTSVDLSLYHNGSQHYSHIHTPLGIAHNDLAGLQGGTTGQFYHVTLDQNGALTGTSGQPSASNPYVTQASLTTEQGTRSQEDQNLQNQIDTVVSVANSAYGIAQIGTNTGTAAYDLAAAAYALALSGTSSGSYSGTLAQTAYDRANAAYALAMVGTNTGTAALQAASIAQATADAAFLVAAAGTDAGTIALAAAGVAQATADAAFLVAVAGTNAAAAAQSRANAAYALAQIGTNTGTAAYNLAESGSNVAWAAWQLAQQGTVAPALSQLTDVSIPSPNANDVLTYNGATWIASPSTGGSSATQFGITVDGGGVSITSGLKGYVRLPRTFTITGWDLVADQNGNCVVDVWKTTYTGFPPTVANTITASAKPTLTGALKATGTVPGWGTAVTAGDYAAFNVDSAASVTRIHLAIYGTI